MMRRTLFTLGLVPLLLAGADRVPLFAGAPRGVNAAAPAFSLPDSGGTTRHLAELTGQVVLVDFWASWCLPCKAAFPKLDALHRELQPRGFTVLAINLDEQRRAADTFLAARPHVMPILFDPTGRTATAFGIAGMPSSVLIDKRGVIRFVHMGYTEKTLTQYRREITQLIEERAE